MLVMIIIFHIQAIKDWMLTVGVLLLACIDLVLLSIYIAVEETTEQSIVHAKLIPSKELQQEMV